MTVVRLDRVPVDTVRDIVQKLKNNGREQGIDFDWAYHPGRWDPMIGDIDKYVNFKFYKDHYATWFNLQHGGTTTDNL